MRHYRLLFACVLLLMMQVVNGQNPIIRDQFTADPSARVFGDKVYLFPSHDILGKEGQGRPKWFCMEDYHVFSSSDLSNWTDHGVILSQDKVPWTNPTGYAFWAPDCIERNGKYYFYFPAPGKAGRGGSSIGVAVAENPAGPYIPEAEPIKGANGIDPNPFIDKDGQAYLYWSMNRVFVAKLNENMKELTTQSVVIKDLPQKGLVEGPYLFERNGIYYMTYPHVENTIERLEYAMGDNPMGPFKVAGVVMDESPMNCWTNHHSFIEYKGQWYLFYHQNEYSPKFDKNRAVCIDSMFFNADGTIQKVKPTHRGVGITDASQHIQIDRFSMMSEKGASIAYLDTMNYFAGWKAQFESVGSWFRYNAVDFGKGSFKNVTLQVSTTTGGTVEIRLDKNDGPLVASIKIPAGEGWRTIIEKVKTKPKGKHDLVVVLTSGSAVNIDWLTFGK